MRSKKIWVLILKRVALFGKNTVINQQYLFWLVENQHLRGMTSMAMDIQFGNSDDDDDELNAHCTGII